MAKRAAASFGIFLFSVILIVLMQNCSNSSSSSPEIVAASVAAPQIVWSPVGANITEGLSDTVYVSLSRAPTSPYSVTLTSSNPAFLNVSPATLVFNSNNWNVAQAITATAAHDANGADENLTVTASGGGLESAALAIAVYDDDICGDGAITGGEQCDDANTVATDGCHSCQTTTGYYCNGAPSTCIAVCGDGLKYGAEQCDDSNTRGGDGCSASCTIEP